MFDTYGIKLKPRFGDTVMITSISDEIGDELYIGERGKIKRVLRQNADVGESADDPFIIVDMTLWGRDGFWTEEMTIISRPWWSRLYDSVKGWLER